jgi:hypothetical protein
LRTLFHQKSSARILALSLAGFVSLTLNAAIAADGQSAAAPAAAVPAVAPAAAAPAAAPAAAAPAVAPAAAAPAAAPAAPAAAAVPVAVPAPIQLVGTYDVTGVNATDKSKYEGVVSVTKQGEAFRVKYKIADDDDIKGIAILTGDVLSIAAIYEKQPTVVTMKPTPTGWSGHWGLYKDEFLSNEEWKRR